MTRSMLEPPTAAARVGFGPEWGQRFLLTVDTEEEFDWSRPLQADGHSLDHVPRLRKFQQFCENQGVVPVYLVDWPIATSPLAAEILREPLAAGLAEIGVQLHPWVNPPHDEEVSPHNSYAGNLPAALERAKFEALRAQIADAFGQEPRIYRAGRYGLGPNTAQILADNGIAIDTSVRAKFDYSSEGGPNYCDHPLEPYWVERGTLIELPLTSVYRGLLRPLADRLYPALWRVPSARGLLSRARLLERIPLTPEGVTAQEAMRGISVALADGLPLLVLSFHSPSLEPGYTPYVATEDDLDRLYAWWRTIFAHLRNRAVRPTSVAEILPAAGIGALASTAARR